MRGKVSTINKKREKHCSLEQIVYCENCKRFSHTRFYIRHFQLKWLFMWQTHNHTNRNHRWEKKIPLHRLWNGFCYGAKWHFECTGDTHVSNGIRIWKRVLLFQGYFDVVDFLVKKIKVFTNLNKFHLIKDFCFIIYVFIAKSRTFDTNRHRVHVAFDRDTKSKFEIKVAACRFGRHVRIL